MSDTGKGIARERLSELFQPFQRLSEDVAVEGTGIGLVITLRLIELMGGAMGVDSEIGQGSRFWFELPPATPAEALVHPAGPQLHQLSGATDGAPRLVLYIDDNPANLRLMTEIIALEPRLRLLTAATPGLGLDLARAEPPALILLDLQLPEMSGLALLELLRQEPALAKVPVVAVTSQGSERDIAIGTAAGFDDYIVKPFAVNRLLATVARLLGRPGV